MTTGCISAICTSAQKGTLKTAVATAACDDQGIVGDAHAGPWHRQVSLMAEEDVAPLAAELGRALPPGAFGENIRVTGLPLAELPLGTCLGIGQVRLEITQLGKECHNGGCPIKRQTGRCVMPTRGVFCRVLHGGELRSGEVIQAWQRRVRLITVNDRCAAGAREDGAGQALAAAIEAAWPEMLVEPDLVAGDPEAIATSASLAVAEGVDLILIVGGTGRAPRDHTTEAVGRIIERPVPGIPECLHSAGAAPASLAGTAGRSLIVILSGSPRAACEQWELLQPLLPHALAVLRGTVQDCARPTVPTCA